MRPIKFRVMNQVICWILGHHWYEADSMTGSDGIYHGEICARCDKTRI